MHEPTLFDLPPVLAPFPDKPGFAVQRDEHTGGIGIRLPDADLLYVPSFLAAPAADGLIGALLANTDLPVAGTDWLAVDPQQVGWENIRWQRDHIRMFGKTVAVPRFSAWYGDEGKSYTYSGLKLNPHPWNDLLQGIREAVEQQTGCAFNSVLLNWYRDGTDSMGWHADDEPELGPNPVIASVNLGASRRFLLRRKDDHQCKWELTLTHGSLLLMRGRMQHFWQHAIPKEKKITSLRINLTFRTIC